MMRGSVHFVIFSCLFRGAIPRLTLESIQNLRGKHLRPALSLSTVPTFLLFQAATSNFKCKFLGLSHGFVLQVFVNLSLGLDHI